MGIKNYVSISWAVLLAIPSIISAVMKMAYAKRRKIVPVTFVARLGVGLTYVAIISILINFEYNFYLLAATVVTVYMAMIVYVFKVFTLKPVSTGKKST
ncbi:hypothetical protein HYX03_00375 [Candidatus Woesearchaeota archaeon]|nr:hypothetical protein [Candidatus Woesearchaeota archaeon]